MHYWWRSNLQNDCLEDNKYNCVSSNYSSCKNGEEGLAKLEDLKNSNHETVAFLDINMTGLNGWDVLDGISQNDFHTLSKLQIYMVSSSTDERDLLKSKQYSFVKGFLYKPLSKEDLISAIGSE